MKHKYSTSLCLRALALLLLVCSSLVALAQNFTQNGVNYYIDGTTAYVASSDEATGAITILDKITVDGTNYPVTMIYNNAFCYNATITSVTIPNSVQTIGGHAFSHCDALVTVTIGSGVTCIGYDAFFGSGAIEDVYLNADPETLDWDEGDYDDFKSNGSTIGHVTNAAAWYNKFAGIVNLTFRDSSTTPFSYSYNESTHTLTISGTELMPRYSQDYDRPWNAYAYEIQKIVINNGVCNISRKAFRNCSALTSITIPNSLRVIEKEAFSGCTSLPSINIPAAVNSSITPELFSACYSLTAINVANDNPLYKTINGDVYSKDGTTFLCLAPGKTSTTIANGVTNIDIRACYDCTNLTSVEFPNTLVGIGGNAFSSCNNLTSIDLPNSLNRIGDGAFYYCYGLTSLKIPDGVESIDYESFAECSGLKSVSIGKGVSLINVSAFKGCRELEDFYVNKSNPYIKSIGGIICTKDGTELVLFPCGRSSIVIPENVTYIPGSFFQGAPNLTSVTLPSTLTAIGSNAFLDCIALTSVTIPNSVTSIGNNAFRGCPALTTVIIGSGVTSIESDAFYASKAITDVYCYADPETLEWIDQDYDEFQNDKATICHVFNADAFKAKWDKGDTSTDVRVTFQGDLLPQVATENLAGSDITTYYNGTENVKAPKNVTVFKVSLSGSKLTATEIEDRIINAGQGVILRANDKIIAMATTTETSTASYSDNILEGVDVDTTKPSGYKYYTIGLSQGNIAFPEIPGKKLLAHKAFIKSTSGPSGGYTFDNVTGIETMDNGQQATEIYNLSGQRLNKMQPGINIVNGKKILMK